MLWCDYPSLPGRPASLLVLPLDMGLAVGIYLDVEAHGAAADRAVLDIVLVRPG